VLMSGTAVANTLYHSCGGGATENNENVFVSSTGAIVSSPVSYLRGSADRAPNGSSYDVASPYDTWQTATYSLAQIQAIFAADTRTNVGTLVAIDISHRGVSGRLISVTLIGANGTTKQVSGDVFVSAFNLHRPLGDLPLRGSLLDLAPIP
jgi:peptidoglycan hydrolase-like amidase